MKHAARFREFHGEVDLFSCSVYEHELFIPEGDEVEQSGYPMLEEIVYDDMSGNEDAV